MKELQRQLIDEISPELQGNGFSYIPTREIFISIQEDTSYRFHVRCLNQKGRLLIEPGVGVRFESVEVIFHRTSGFEPEYQKWTPTIGAELWRLEGNPKAFQYYLAKSEDVSIVARQLIRIFQTKALTYFTAYSSLKAIDHALNDYPLEKTPHRIMEWLRASTGLIVAKFVDRDNYNELKEVYRAKVARLDRGFYLPQFNALVEDLEKVTPLSR